jgi:hypothetical protein
MQNGRQKRMSKEYKGDLIKDPKPKGKMLTKEEKKGDLLKSEGAKGNPLWKDTKINEEKKKKQKLNE